MQVLFPTVDQKHIHIAVTTRRGGVSLAPYHEANLALHVGDDAGVVNQNRQQVDSILEATFSPVWLNQVHGNEVAVVDKTANESIEADASITRVADLPLAIMTADCLPILLWSNDAREVAAVHAGWRGLENKVLQQTIANMNGSDLSAFIGPAILPCHYEVDEQVRRQFPESEAFLPGRPGHYQFDLVAEAKQQLRELGVETVHTSNICTACDERFYSYRRDGETGRFATLIWMSPA